MLPRPKLEGKNLKDFDGKLFNQDVHISGVSINAQAIKPGDLFIALSGAKTHGLNFVSEGLPASNIAGKISLYQTGNVSTNTGYTDLASPTSSQFGIYMGAGKNIIFSNTF